MIISLRGTNGSGKSWVIRQLLDVGGARLNSLNSEVGLYRGIVGRLGHKRPEAYALTLPRVKGPTYVLGPYVGANCSGVDQITSFEVIPQLIEHYADLGHVVFEGVLISTMYGVIGDLMERWGKQSVFLTLTTPLEQCIRQVNARRGDKGPINPKLMTDKFCAIQRVHERVEKDGIMRSIQTSSDDACDTIIQLLREE